MLVFVVSIFSMNTRDRWAHIQSTQKRKAIPLRRGGGADYATWYTDTTHAEHQSSCAHPRLHLLILPPFLSLFSFAFEIKNYTITICTNEQSNGMPRVGFFFFSFLVVPVNKIIRIFKWLREWVGKKWNLGLYLPEAGGFLECLVSVNNVRTELSPGQGCIG